MRMTLAAVLAHEARLNPRHDAPGGEGCSDEAKLHDAIIEVCKARGFYYVHSRMDRATTTALGVVDFVIAADNGKTYWIEAKARKKKPTREQAGTLLWLNNLGHKTAVVRNLDEFLKAIEPNTKVCDGGHNDHEKT